MLGRPRRAPVTFPAAGLLPALFLSGLFVAAPFAGTTTVAVAASHLTASHLTASHLTASHPTASHPPTAGGAAAPVGPAVHLDPHAAAFFVNLYFGIVAVAVAVLIVAIVWLRTADRRSARRADRAARSVTWTDAAPHRVTRGRTVRSPGRAARA